MTAPTAYSVMSRNSRVGRDAGIGRFLRWSFSGIRWHGDQPEIVVMYLDFYPNKRRFKARASRPTKDNHSQERLDLPFVRNQPRQTGRLTDILRAQLADEEIAECFAMSIGARR